MGSEFALSAGTVAPVNAGTTIAAVTGQTLDKTLKLPGCDFSQGQFNLLDQDDNGAAWEIGAGAWEATPTLPCDQDGVCDSGETYLNCPSDCSAPAAGHTEVYQFKFSDANISGSTLDNLTVGGSDGTIHGGVASYPWVGTAGLARMFDGSSGYVSAAALDVTNASGFYILAWIYPTAFATGWESHIAGTPLNYARLILSSGGLPQIITYNSGAHTLASSTAVPLKQVSFVAATHDNTTAKIYINGTLVASRAMLPPSGDDTAFQIGAGSSAWSDPEYFKGAIYSVRAGTGVLTDAEILSLYNSELITGGGTGTPVPCSLKIKRAPCN